MTGRAGRASAAYSCGRIGQPLRRRGGSLAQPGYAQPMPSLSRRLAVCSQQIATVAIAKRHKGADMTIHAIINRRKHIAATATKSFLALAVLALAITLTA